MEAQALTPQTPIIELHSCSARCVVYRLYHNSRSGSCVRVPGPISAERDIYGKARLETHKITAFVRFTENDGHVNEEPAEWTAVCRQKPR